jgi:hemolysin III
MSVEACQYTAVPRRRVRPRERGRDPYDGLRPWSAITHGAGVALGLAGTVFLAVRAVLAARDGLTLAALLIYGLSMVGLYTASTLYHSVNTTVAGRIALRKVDHTSIYFLIAGTYTPICLTALRGAWGYSLLSVIWTLAVAGLFMSLFWIDCPRALTSTIYIAMGWMALVAVYPLWRTVGAAGMFWLLLGGVLYTAGGVLYALKWPGRNNPRFGCHEIFHVFILLGSVAHFVLVCQL